VPKTIDATKTKLGKAGFPKVVDIGQTEALLPPDPAKPGEKISFAVSVSLRYDGVNGPSKSLKITRGYRSWGSPVGTFSPPFFNDELGKHWTRSSCWNLDTQQPRYKDCPADRLRLPKDDMSCDTTSDPRQVINQKVVTDLEDPMRKKTLYAYPPFDLQSTDMLSEVTPTSDKYYYNNGILTFYLPQDDDNAEGTSPIGECLNPTHQTNCPSTCPTFQAPAPDCSCQVENRCPDFAHGETYDPCPPEGCPDYRIKVDDMGYSRKAVADRGSNPASCSSALPMDTPSDGNQLTYATNPLPSMPFTRVDAEKSMAQAFPTQPRPTLRRRAYAR
jgi:hypothetical protein